jgi:hypothetical protein
VEGKATCVGLANTRRPLALLTTAQLPTVSVQHSALYCPVLPSFRQSWRVLYLTSQTYLAAFQVSAKSPLSDGESSCKQVRREYPHAAFVWLTGKL